MVVRSKRTSAVRKIAKRVAKGVKIQHKYRKAKPKYRCAICGRVVKLKGKKMPGRMFAGQLCHQCAERVIRYAARAKVDGIEVVPISYRPYVGTVLSHLQ